MDSSAAFLRFFGQFSGSFWDSSGWGSRIILPPVVRFFSIRVGCVKPLLTEDGYDEVSDESSISAGVL